MMTKQVFELISDATVLDDIHSIGAVIVRLRSHQEGTYVTAYKYIYIYKAKDSSEAELLAGLYGLEQLKSVLPFDQLSLPHCAWIMDIPHIRSYIAKLPPESSPAPGVSSQVFDIVKDQSFSIRLPKKKADYIRHNLCHRHCSISRDFYNKSGGIRAFLDTFGAFLENTHSSWKFCDQFIQDI